MKYCRKIMKDWRSHLLSEGSAPENVPLRRHLETCAACRTEAVRLLRLLGQAEIEKEEVRRAMDSVDWGALPARIADRAFLEAGKAAGPEKAEGFRRFFPVLPARPAFAALVLGVVLGAAGMYFAVKRSEQPGLSDPGFFASRPFIDRIEEEMARRDAIDFLERSQYLLLDFLQFSEASEPGTAVFGSSARMRELLDRKKFLNAHFESPRMVQAKAVCDRIELLFTELYRLSDELTVDEAVRIRSFIEDRQLLLNIRLARRELQGSEV